MASFSVCSPGWALRWPSSPLSCLRYFLHTLIKPEDVLTSVGFMVLYGDLFIHQNTECENECLVLWCVVLSLSLCGLVGFQHFAILLKYVIHVAIPDIPGWVADEMAKLEYRRREAFKVYRYVIAWKTDSLKDIACQHQTCCWLPIGQFVLHCCISVCTRPLVSCCVLTWNALWLSLFLDSGSTWC